MCYNKRENCLIYTNFKLLRQLFDRSEFNWLELCSIILPIIFEYIFMLRQVPTKYYFLTLSLAKTVLTINIKTS